MYSVCIPYTVDGYEKNQWNHVLLNWNIDKIYLLSDINPREDTWCSAPLLRGSSVSIITSVSEIPEQLVCASPKNSSILSVTNNLNTFVHPETCCYVFGSNSSLEFPVPEANTVVYVDTISELYSWCACAILLYDRSLKNAN